MKNLQVSIRLISTLVIPALMVVLSLSSLNLSANASLVDPEDAATDFGRKPLIVAKPLIIIVNGYNNCCAGAGFQATMRSISNADVVVTSYSDFEPGKMFPGSGTFDGDDAFISKASNFLNNQFDKSRPVVLIGHSFGADSIMKLLPQLNRKIEMVVVIDTVRAGGHRSVYSVPRNVDYFLNRWQSVSPWPIDLYTSGHMPCLAKVCDQDEQNISRNNRGEPNTTSCEWYEFCSGEKQKRTGHQRLATDDYVVQSVFNVVSLLSTKGYTVKPPHQL
jgi:hypothetical protein